MARLLTRAPGDAPETFAEHGGYVALERARAASAEAVLGWLRDADLRGRGGAGFPAWRKWDLARRAPSGKKYVVVNGGEHEPGSKKDRFLVAHMPHAVLEGALLCAHVTGAT